MIQLKSVKESMKATSEVLQISSELMSLMGQFLRKEGFIEILPVIISPITDPLNHSVFDASIDYYDFKYCITKSMIFHKQLAMRVYPKIFSFSPNVRLETKDKMDSGRHLIEFTQLDLEVKEASRDDILDLIERMLSFVFEEVGKRFDDTITKLNPRFGALKTPFKRVRYLEAQEKYGNDFENILSLESTQPFWLIDIPTYEREFYDKLSDDKQTLVDMDLIYPFGYGEGLSGGERESEYDRIIERMKFKNTDIDSMKWYLDEVKEGIFPSAGCGIGIERLTRFLCGLDNVDETRLFPKVPGSFSI